MKNKTNDSGITYEFVKYVDFLGEKCVQAKVVGTHDDTALFYIKTWKGFPDTDKVKVNKSVCKKDTHQTYHEDRFDPFSEYSERNTEWLDRVY